MEAKWRTANAGVNAEVGPAEVLEHKALSTRIAQAHTRAANPCFQEIRERGWSARAPVAGRAPGKVACTPKYAKAGTPDVQRREPARVYNKYGCP
eukprot:3187879-Pleurochrysis_carterae.AAC.3